MAKRARQIAKKVRDRWKAKTWYQVLTPTIFDGKPIAETIADDPEKILDRVLETTMQDVSGDFSKMHVKLYFKVHRVRGSDALTDFVGHELTSDYVRRMTRRKRSKVDVVTDVTTKDGWRVRVKPMAITSQRIKSSQMRAIRASAVKVCGDVASASTIGEFVKTMIDGDLATKIYHEAKPVYPVKRVEVRKSEVLAAGQRPSPPATSSDGGPAGGDGAGDEPATAAAGAEAALGAGEEE